MVQIPFDFTQRSSREILGLCKAADPVSERRIVLFIESNVWRSKSRERAVCALSRRYVKVVCIHGRMGTRYYYGFRFEFRYFACDFFVGFCSLFDLCFTASSDVRNDHRRMRYHECCKDGHNASLLLWLPVWLSNFLRKRISNSLQRFPLTYIFSPPTSPVCPASESAGRTA